MMACRIYEVFGVTWRFMGGICMVISRVAILITHIRGLITPLIATHEPPSTPPGPETANLKT